jgi:hypothetical protein
MTGALLKDGFSVAGLRGPSSKCGCPARDKRLFSATLGVFGDWSGEKLVERLWRRRTRALFLRYPSGAAPAVMPGHFRRDLPRKFHGESTSLVG